MRDRDQGCLEVVSWALLILFAISYLVASGFREAADTDQATAVEQWQRTTTGHGVIPDFFGKTPEEVKKLLEAEGLHQGSTFLWSTNQKEYDGKVTDQDPPPGTPRTEYDKVSLVYGSHV